MNSLFPFSNKDLHYETVFKIQVIRTNQATWKQTSYPHTQKMCKHKRIAGNNEVGKIFLITMFGSGKTF